MCQKKQNNMLIVNLFNYHTLHHLIACFHLPHRATLRYHDRNTGRMRIPENHAAQFDIDGRCRAISPTK